MCGICVPDMAWPYYIHVVSGHHSEEEERKKRRGMKWRYPCKKKNQMERIIRVRESDKETWDFCFDPW